MYCACTAHTFETNEANIMRSTQRDSVESLIKLNVGVSCILSILCLVSIQKKGAFIGGDNEHTKNFISTESWKMGFAILFSKQTTFTPGKQCVHSFLSEPSQR